MARRRARSCSEQEDCMSRRWTIHEELDNAGRAFRVWRSEEYELSRNVNLGLDGGWVFELVYRGRAIGLFPTLQAGQQGAAEHRNPKPDPEEIDTASERADDCVGAASVRPRPLEAANG
jgi:hypothetical protein